MVRLKKDVGNMTFSVVTWRLGSDGPTAGWGCRKSRSSFFYAFFDFNSAFLDFDPAL
jgi:hypothetical protein